MKCRDESKLLNYQEPYNYLCRNIKFYKPGQITSFLPPVCLWGSERQQESTLPEEVFINAPVISFDLHSVWGKTKMEELSFSQVLYVCTGRPGIFIFCFLPFRLLLSTKIKFLCSCGYPWSYFCWQIHCQLWRRNWSSQEMLHSAGCSVNILWALWGS